MKTNIHRYPNQEKKMPNSNKTFDKLLLNFLLENDLSLTNNETSKKIKASDGYDYKWEVVEFNRVIGMEYKTLNGAVNNSKK